MQQATARAVEPSVTPPERAATTPQETKVLRVGVILDGRIIEEQIITRRTSVTVGHSERATFVVPSADLPGRLVLFERRGEGYRLNVTPTMRGRIARNGDVDDIEVLRSSRANRGRGGALQIDLDESTRGKVVIGEHTLIFQFVLPPRTQPLPQLPASVRGRWIKNVDWFFAALLSASFLVQMGLVVYLAHRDWPADRLAVMPGALYRDYGRPPQMPAELAPLDNPANAPDGDAADAHGATPAPTKADAPRTKTSAKRASRGADPADAARAAAQRQARLREALSDAAKRTVDATILGARGDGGALADLMKQGGVPGDLDHIIANADAVRIASSRQDTLLRRPGRGSDGDARPATIGSLRPTRPAGEVASDAMGDERQVSGRVATRAPTPQPSPGAVPADEVRRIVRRNIGGIKACYERALPRNPTLSGRITISFTIGGGGRVVRARASQDTMGAPSVTSCVEQRFRGMRFPEPQGGQASFSFPFLFEPRHY